MASLLEVSPNDLTEALLTRVIAASGQIINKQHSVTEAAVSR